MKSITPIIAVIAAALLIFIGWEIWHKPAEPVVVSSEEAQEVGAVVTAFGERLKLVSLLAPADVLRTEMQDAYGRYVAPELIEKWLKDPQNAPGRLTSSPAPERINIVETKKNSDGTYTVEGNIVETAQGSVASVTQATFTLEKRNGSWLIIGFNKGPVSNPPQRVSLTGTYICLPHKDTSGPQTLECALGMKTDAGVNYAVDFNLYSGARPEINTGERFSANGILTPVENLSSTQWQKYDIKGIFSITDSFKKLSAAPGETSSNGIPNLITVATPTNNQKVSSPLTVTGSARGTWYFEASFPVELRNAAGTIIAQTPAQAQSDWMTTNFVVFKATLTFPAQPAGSKGTLILRKDNPSGDPARDQSVSVPVTF